MKYLLLLLLILLVSRNCFAQKVTRIEAQTVAKLAHKQMMSGIDSPTKTPIVLGSESGNDTLLYVFPYERDGFAIISANKAAPPLLGFSETGSFDLAEIPPGLAYFIEKYKYNIQRIIKNKTKTKNENKALWNNYLEGIPLKSYSTNTILVNASWGQNNDYTLYTPNNFPAGCTAVAMAQILWYWATETCGIEPTGWINYQGLGYMGASANFGTTTYNWGDMNPSYADDDNALLIFHAGASCETHYNSDVSSSTPGRARDGFVTFWGISPNADVKWRISHLQTWEDMLKDEIDLERPLLYSGAQNVFGIDGEHSWIVDGYTNNNLFHCNWGWDEDPSYTWLSLGNWDPEGDGNPYNQYESAIFNVYPERTDGVETPYLSNQTFTYNPAGYTLSVYGVFGATSYEWTTDVGTISGNGTTVTLYADNTANVQVRAYNELCDIYSPYSSATITINCDPPNANDFEVYIEELYGNPVPGSPDGPFEICDGERYWICLYPFFLFDDYGITDVEFDFNFDYDVLDEGDDYIEIEINSNPNGESGEVYVTTSCGYYTLKYLEFEEGSCGSYYMMFTPNPTTGETTLSIEQGEAEEPLLKSGLTSQVFDENEEWNLEVYSPGQSLQHKKTGLKGKSTKIQTQGWTEGVYTVCVKYKNEILTGKLVVKK